MIRAMDAMEKTVARWWAVRQLKDKNARLSAAVMQKRINGRGERKIK
jgi:hypothetical protein